MNLSIFFGQKMEICVRLKEERERIGLSQTEFGRLGGAGKTTVISWERGTAFPNAAFLAAVAAEGVDVQYVITGIRSAVALSKDEVELLDRFRAASLEVKAAAIGALTAGANQKAAVTRQTMVFHREVGQPVNVEGDLHQKKAGYFEKRSKKK